MSATDPVEAIERRAAERFHADTTVTYSEALNDALRGADAELRDAFFVAVLDAHAEQRERQQCERLLAMAEAAVAEVLAKYEDKAQ